MDKNPIVYSKVNETQLAAIAKQLALGITPLPDRAVTIFLQGDLGAGKTTCSRYFIQALGHNGAVKSPTYTLVESYPLPLGPVHHFDLYRLRNHQELEEIGFRDYMVPGSLCLIEWPERLKGLLLTADITILLQTNGTEHRQITLTAHSNQGNAILAQQRRPLL